MPSFVFSSSLILCPSFFRVLDPKIQWDRRGPDIVIPASISSLHPSCCSAATSSLVLKPALWPANQTLRITAHSPVWAQSGPLSVRSCCRMAGLNFCLAVMAAALLLTVRIDGKTLKCINRFNRQNASHSVWSSGASLWCKQHVWSLLTCRGLCEHTCPIHTVTKVTCNQ